MWKWLVALFFRRDKPWSLAHSFNVSNDSEPLMRNTTSVIAAHSMDCRVEIVQLSRRVICAACNRFCVRTLSLLFEVCKTFTFTEKRTSMNIISKYWFMLEWIGCVYSCCLLRISQRLHPNYVCSVICLILVSFSMTWPPQTVQLIN